MPYPTWPEPHTRPAAGVCSPPVLTDGPYAESKEYCLSSAGAALRRLPDDAIRAPAQERRSTGTQYLARLRRTD